MNGQLGGDGAEYELTPIPARIHSGAEESDVERAELEAFVDTIADIAMSVATRTVAREEKQE